MKRFKIGISAIVLLLAIGTSFAFRGAEKKNTALLTCVWYDFTGSTGQEHDPNMYSLSAGDPSCPSEGGPLCSICVDAGEIYGTGEAYPGLPKVDDDWTGIYNVVTYALQSQSDNYQLESFNEIAELKAP